MVDIQLQLTEQLPTLVVDSFDGAICLWNAPDQRAAEWGSRRLASHLHMLVAAPAHLQARGTPRTLQGLATHACLVVRKTAGASAQRFDHWRLQRAGEVGVQRVPVLGSLCSNSGEMVRDWCLSGHGIMLCRWWGIAAQLASGALVRVLPDHAMPDADVHGLAPCRAQVPRRIQRLVDFRATHLCIEPWKLRQALSAAPPGSPRKR